MTIRRRKGELGKVSPNKMEVKLHKMLKKYFPGKFRINVKGKVVIGSKIPDFIHSNRKILIELFGNYWHGFSMTGETPDKHERSRINYFAKFGYKTIVIWTSELTNETEVVEKVLKGVK